MSSGRIVTGRVHKKEMDAYEKKIPTFKSDRAAAAFVDRANLTKFDLSGARLTRFEVKPKNKSICELHEAVRKRRPERECRIKDSSG